MSSSIHRRSFLQTAGAAAGLALVSLRGSRALGFAPAAGAPHAEKLGWRLGCQAYSFNRYTFYEAIDKNASLGLHYIEAYPGQKMSTEKPDAKINESLAADLRREVKAKLADCGVKLVNYGVCGPASSASISRT